MAGGDEGALVGPVRLQATGKIPDIGNRNDVSRLHALGLNIDQIEAQFVLGDESVDAAIAAASETPGQIAPAGAIAGR